MVVDDEPLVCEAVKMLLNLTATKFAASSGNEALVLFGQGRFDLVITDYTMPVMKGDELALALMGRVPGQPVIMLTAHAEMIRTAAVPLTGVDQLVSKPFQFADLQDAIERATAR